MTQYKELTREELISLLKQLGKEIRKEIKDERIEVVIVGGASVLFNYDFRFTSHDIDAFTNQISNEYLKELTNKIADKNGVDRDWFNQDFKKTDSFSHKIIGCSEYFATFGGLTVRTVKDEYLVAMKLISDRYYKHDMSDILGVIISNDNITKDKIDNALETLYGENPKINQNYYEIAIKCLELSKEKVEKVRSIIITKENFNLELVKEDNENRNKLEPFDIENIITNDIEFEELEVINDDNDITDTVDKSDDDDKEDLYDSHYEVEFDDVLPLDDDYDPFDDIE